MQVQLFCAVRRMRMIELSATILIGRDFELKMGEPPHLSDLVP